MAWGSGTGGAALAGAGLYSLATTGFGMNVQMSLFASVFLPVIMLNAFFIILSLEPLKREPHNREASGYTILQDQTIVNIRTGLSPTTQHETEPFLNQVPASESSSWQE